MGEVRKWKNTCYNGAGIAIRETADIDGARTAHVMDHGKTFDVSEEKEGANGVIYLKLSDGRGWLFDKKPGVGAMCSLVKEEAASSPKSSADAPTQKEGVVCKKCGNIMMDDANFCRKCGAERAEATSPSAAGSA